MIFLQYCMKTDKEIQLATQTFLHAFDKNEFSELGGTFIPFNSVQIYKQHQFYLVSAISFGLLFCFLSYNAWYIDAIYYWHIDLPVVIGILVITLFLLLFLFSINQYIKISKTLQLLLQNPNEKCYGVLITDDYYFEKSPNEYHIIPRANIVKVDYEETNKDSIYLELLLDLGNHYKIKGLTYKETEYDIRSWIKNY